MVLGLWGSLNKSDDKA